MNGAFNFQRVDVNELPPWSVTSNQELPPSKPTLLVLLSLVH